MKYTDAYIKSDAFLDTFEWRKVRMEAILKYGKRCQCCGAVPLPSNDVKIHVDHIIPRKVDPSLALELSNLQVLCNVCNHGKGNWDTTDWREFEPPETSVKYSCGCKVKVSSEERLVSKPASKQQLYLAYDIKIPTEIRSLTRKIDRLRRVELGFIITNLLFSVVNNVSLAYSRTSSSNVLKTKRRTSTLKVMSAINVLEKNGLLVNVIGQGSKEKKFRKSSTISPTEKFKETFADLLANEDFMSQIQKDWYDSQNNVPPRESKPKPKVKPKKKVLPNNNLKVRKDVMKELLTVLTTWR